MAVSDHDGSSEGDPLADLTPEQYEWLQEQLRAATQLEVEDEYEDEWEDPSGGLLTEIFAACESGSAPDLQQLLEQLKSTDFSLDTPGQDGDTPLHIACLYGNLECVELLLKHGSNPATANPEDGTSALHDAAAGGYLEIVELLMDRVDAAGSSDALINMQDADGDTPLHNAARGEHPKVVKFLLTQGADQHLKNSSDRTPADETNSEEILDLLSAAAEERTLQAGGGDGEGDAGQQ